MGTDSRSWLTPKRLPTEVIKIDHFFVESLGEDIEAMAVLRMIIGLAHSLSY